MKKFISLNTLSALSLAVFVSIAVSSPSLAVGIMDGVNAAHGTGTPEQLFGDTGIITAVTNTMLFIVGALSVVMIIIGGIRYTISGGNSANVTAAKNTIMYALVGLVIAFLSFAVVNFILGVFAGGGESGFTNV